MKDYSIAILAAVIVALLIRFFVVEAYHIPSPAMRPALEPGDTIFVLKAPVAFDRKAVRGEIVIFQSPADPERDYIKRVIGLPGDTIEVRKGRVKINGKPLSKPDGKPAANCARETLPESGPSYEVCWETPLVEDFGPEKVPEGSVFVLGDFRSQSPADVKKRRSWGIIPTASFKGKAEWIWLSIEPPPSGGSWLRIPVVRWDRMFRRID